MYLHSLNLTESLIVEKLEDLICFFIMCSSFIKAFFVEKFYEAFFQFLQMIYHLLLYQAR